MELHAALSRMPSPLSEAETLPEGQAHPVLLPCGEARLLVCGIGPINAALHLGKALAESPARGVVNLGVAGSFDTHQLPLGSVALATEERWPEFGLRTASGMVSDGLGFALANGPDGPIYDRLNLAPDSAAKAMGLAPSPAWPQVRSLTVAGVTGTPERAADLAQRTGTMMENMEGFALALGCARAEVPFLELRSISNAVGLRPPEGWDLPGALTALGEAAAHLFGAPQPEKVLDKAANSGIAY
jgi:futalosine hydrolase